MMRKGTSSRYKQAEIKQKNRNLTTTDLIGARVGHIDDASCLFGLQVGDEATFQGLCLTEYIFLVTTTG